MIRIKDKEKFLKEITIKIYLLVIFIYFLIIHFVNYYILLFIYFLIIYIIYEQKNICNK